MTKTKLINVIFIALQAILFILIQTIPNAIVVRVLCFSSIVCALIVSLLAVKKGISNVIVSVALFFTMCADFCLIIIEPQSRNLAMIFFSFVQISYFFLLLLKETYKERITHIFIRAGAIVLIFIITVVVLKDKTDFLSIVSMIYFVNLVVNFIFSFLHLKETILLTIGLACFICCDILVGLGVANGIYFNIPNGSFLYNIVYSQFNLIWCFYIFSQTLIVLSTRVSRKTIVADDKEILFQNNNEKDA